MAGNGAERASPPRHFYLNEAHELASLQPEGGGRAPQFADVDWAGHANHLRSSWARAAAVAERSPDPAMKKHSFVGTAPASLIKVSKSKAAEAAGGRVRFRAQFGGAQANLFNKLGMDLLDVDAAGNATVHVAAPRLPQLQAKLQDLFNAPRREQARWLHIAEFFPVGWTRRVDPAWLDVLDSDAPADVHLRFHALLQRGEVLEVLEAIGGELVSGERLLRTGRDFSGRHWCIAKALPQTIRALAERFPSLQSIHPRLSTAVAAERRGQRAPAPTPPPAPAVDVSSLPTVAMFDTGVPAQHPVLRQFVRGRYVDPALSAELAPTGHHGSHVASAIVFGHTRAPVGAAPESMPPPTCRVFDVLGGWTYKRAEVPDELWDQAIDAVIGQNPDIRVFNLSLGGPRLNTLRDKEREEKLRYLQDLDNHAFARDLLLVIAAGNSPPGLTPANRYPAHLDDPAWGLGVLASTFNGLVVGAHVDPVVPTGVARRTGAPSPFTLVGPGQHRAPVPGFSAPGGDATQNYRPAPGSGVWVYNADGQFEDSAGTSLAAPLVAREAAFALRDLAPYCADGPPFAATVRAWLTLIADRPRFDGALEKLAARTVGGGFPDSERIRVPHPERAVFVWQTVLESAGTAARVSFPVPREWLNQATAPTLRLVVAWLTPVNASLTDTWACRRVEAQLRTTTDAAAPALRRGPGAIGAYPIIDSTVDVSLSRLEANGQAPTGDLWSLTVSYKDLGPPPAGVEFAPQQRVGVAMELFDAGEAPVSPQAAVQAAPVPQMNRLPVLQAPARVPITTR
jgi:hypothetical protein